MKIPNFTNAFVLFALGLSGVADAALLSRAGGLAYYDDQLDITWLADANIIGHATWDDANTWADGLTVGGVAGWRLPNMDVNGDGAVVDCETASAMDCLDNEYGFHLWHNAITADNPGPFGDVRYDDFYWSGTTSSTDTQLAWVMLMNPAALQFATDKGESYYTWAVNAGDVYASQVPIPAAAWLFASGLLGLLGVKAKASKCPRV